VREMADGLVRQVMTFVEHVEGVAWIGQDRTAAQREVSQDHVVVGDDDVDLSHAFARFIESALLKIRTMSVGALAVIGGQTRPVLIRQLLGPTVAVAVPFVAGKLLDHVSEELLTGLVDLDLEAFLLEQLGRGALRIAFLQAACRAWTGTCNARAPWPARR
jgi:hypothetical protein